MLLLSTAYLAPVQYYAHLANADESLIDIHEHYLGLSEEDQGKDWKPFNSMLKLLKKFDGIRIYKLDTEE